MYVIYHCTHFLFTFVIYSKTSTNCHHSDREYDSCYLNSRIAGTDFNVNHKIITVYAMKSENFFF